jgi:hypothetical protein
MISVIERIGRLSNGTPVPLWLRIVILCGVLVGGAAVSSAGAQDVQVPFDRDSTVYSVDPDLRQRVGLFPDVQGFQGAELYRVDRTTYELVVRYESEGRVRRERRSLTAAEVEDLRSRVTRALTSSPAPESRTVTQDGRYGLIAATTVHGLTQGSLLAGAVGAEGESVLTFPLVGGTLGFFAPLLATRTARVTDGEADMTFYGGVQGYVHAVQLAGLVGGDAIDGRTTAGLAALTGAIEGTVAYRVARTRNWSGGHAEMVSYNGLGGNLVGLGLSAAVIGEDGEEEPRLVAGTTLLGSVAGAYLGHRMGRGNRYTEGDARVYLQTAVQGVNLTGSFLSLRDDGAVRPAALLLTGSAVGGAVLGRRLVRNRDFTGTQSALIGLGSLAGSLAGLAVTVEADAGSSRAIVQALGSAVGFGVTYAVLEEDARRQAASSPSALDLRMRVEPSLAGAWGATDGGGETLAPRVTLTATF